MLEVGFGLIAANLVVLYGPLVSVARRSQLKTSSGTTKFNLLDLKPEFEARALHSDEGRTWDANPPSVPSLAACNGDTYPGSDEERDLRGIHVVRTMEVTQGYI